MIERARELGALRLAALLAVTLALAGGTAWLLADGGDSTSTIDLAVRSPEPGSGPPSTTPRNENGGRADQAADRKREQGRERVRRERARTTRRPHRERVERSTSGGGQKAEAHDQDVKRVVENLLGGGDPDRRSSQPAQPDLPPEVAALLQGGDEEGPSKPQPGLEELLEGSSAGD